MWEIFTQIFGNILTDIIILIFLLVGVIVGIMWRPGFGNHVRKLIPREHRFVDFPIEDEYACSVECKNQKGYPKQRFFKYAPAFMGQLGKYVKRPAMMFLGKEGTAYTWKEHSGKVDIGKLDAALKTVWGEDFYNQIPPEQRALIEESKINVTVDLESGLTPEGYTPVSEEDIKTEQDRKAAETYWEGKKSADKPQLLNIIITVLAGVGIGFIIAWLLKVGGTTTVVQQPSTAMSTILHVLMG
jgi:hypothetical protein